MPGSLGSGRKPRLSILPKKKKTDPRPTTASSMASTSSSSSSSTRHRSYTGLTIDSIQEDLSPLSAFSGSPPSSYSPNFSQSPLHAYSPNRRRPSQASESHDTFAESAPSFFPTSYSHDTPRIDISRAPRLELAHLESPKSPSSTDRIARLPLPPRSHTVGSLDASARSILTVDSASQEPLLQKAISDKDRLVYTSGSTVVAGTLEGLVDRLVDNFSK